MGPLSIAVGHVVMEGGETMEDAVAVIFTHSGGSRACIIVLTTSLSLALTNDISISRLQNSLDTRYSRASRASLTPSQSHSPYSHSPQTIRLKSARIRMTNTKNTTVLSSYEIQICSEATFI